MRWIEVALLLAPAALVVAWIYGIRGLSRRGVIAAVILLAACEGTLFWLGSDRAVSGRYVPAHVVNGRIVEGHGK